MTSTVHLTNGRSLVPDRLFAKLVARLVRDGHRQGRAELIVDQALAFLGACAVNVGEPLTPSPLVDEGWHAFVLHTREYAEFCRMIAGRFLHHRPSDEPMFGSHHLERSKRAIHRAGYLVRDELWLPSSAVCTQCHGGCHDDPPPPPAS
ncbi:hypothetical protein [Alloactinosynnema sp. L-07]|uniref:glycine-rich domain-containing protein n=1 Tax=Alloactinosynnema sp. L-07 TaxID=1653480 RepID=UPI00065EFF5A|nr:hypothetical protein [Alloactinosynnema sp. L-07]CRK55024.1 hypothetical protein [Alloactinosynnema sp. L-07]